MKQEMGSSWTWVDPWANLSDPDQGEKKRMIFAVV